MSGIAGVYFISGQPVDRSVLERMVTSIAHRGPDADGIWCQGAVGLGHRMLWTTPESLGEQLPLLHPTGDLAITADARIDNRDELIAALGLDSYPTLDITDSQLILAAYEKWGDRCPAMLLGDFVFVIWDGRRQVVFCARDPMGVKSLYYYHSSQVFGFASEIKALFCLPQVPRRLNETRVADHLAGIYEDKTSTFYQDVFRLPPAHSMMVGTEGAEIRSYWSVDLSHEVHLSSDEQYAEAFREVFSEAVRCRLRSAYPIGTTLSGGLDSSSIACTARNVLADYGEPRLHTFSAIFPSLPESDLRMIDERQYIAAVLATDGFEAHQVRADLVGPLEDTEQVLWHVDEAFFAPNLYMHWALYNAAQRQGVRVFLDGLDGDTTVSHGLDYLADLTRAGRWTTLVREANALAKKAGSSFTPRRIIYQYGLRPLVPNSIVRIRRRLQGRDQPTWAVNSVINPAFARRIGLTERMNVFHNERSRVTSTAKEKHYLSVSSGLNPYTLELADKVSAAFSLEARYPFFDRRLMEFCIALPPSQKLNQGWTRIILRRAMADVLPSVVQWRFAKANLSPNFQRNLLEDRHRALHEIFLDRPRFIEDYVDVAALEAAYDRYISQPLRKNQEALSVYRVLILALWLRLADLSR